MNSHERIIEIRSTNDEAYPAKLKIFHFGECWRHPGVSAWVEFPVSISYHGGFTL